MKKDLILLGNSLGKDSVSLNNEEIWCFNNLRPPKQATRVFIMDGRNFTPFTTETIVEGVMTKNTDLFTALNERSDLKVFTPYPVKELKNNAIYPIKSVLNDGNYVAYFKNGLG